MSKHRRKYKELEMVKRGEYRSGGQPATKTGEQSMWTFEPSMALEILKI
ncbi:hypothetical protein [Reichenbachiella sp. MALMAid0571]